MRRILTTLIVIALALCAACVDPDDGADRTDTGQTAEQAIETVGAQQWHAQLTAVAETEEP